MSDRKHHYKTAVLLIDGVQYPVTDILVTWPAPRESALGPYADPRDIVVMEGKFSVRVDTSKWTGKLHD